MRLYEAFCTALQSRKRMMLLTCCYLPARIKEAKVMEGEHEAIAETSFVNTVQNLYHNE